jgi:hypothetical protein
MLAILVEGALFVAAVATVAALVFLGVATYTPLGLRLRQMENRKRILREVETVCSVHGAHTEDELVRLASGERICPDCFREAVRDSLG